MTDPAIVAEKMGSTAKYNLLHFQSGVDYPFWSVFQLMLGGLIVRKRRWWFFGKRVFRLTPLGLAVHAYLEKVK